jgi:IS4 transposase
VRTYYYGIAGNLKLSPIKLYAFYHKRQRIEAGFRELNRHYHLERLPFKNLKANEFRIACKILTMTMFKMFQKKMLPKSLQHLLLKTFRRILQKGLRATIAGEVEVGSKATNT